MVFVFASSSDPAGLVYLAPYSAMTIAEYFKDRGKDVLIVLDDLTIHAKYYRELSLLSDAIPVGLPILEIFFPSMLVLWKERVNLKPVQSHVCR
jgi:flagellar biosynthesis/type III secretory pathway ATPase